MDAGDLVPDELVIQMILEEIEDKGADGFLLDGFPRSVGQADALDDALDENGRRLTAAVLIFVDDELGDQAALRPAPVLATGTSTTRRSTRRRTRATATSAASRCASATTTRSTSSRSAWRRTMS